METGEIHRDFILYTPYYISPHAERNEENLYCLRKNLENPLISMVVLINEEKALPFEHPKLTHIQSAPRPTFAQIFAETAKQKQDNIIRILANSDIYFDATLEKAKNIQKNEIYALTRWDLQPDGTKKFFLKYHSQDAWIFTSNIDSSIGDFPMGQPGCDNRLVYQFKDNGFKVKNPSFSIHITHVHASGFRPYMLNEKVDYVKGEYAYLMPEFIGKVQKEYARDYYYLNWEYNWYLLKNMHQRLKIYLLDRIVGGVRSIYFFVLFKIHRKQ